MIAIGKRVDHRNGGVLREFIQRALRKYTRDNSVDPLLQILRDILNAFALAQARVRIVEKYGAAAHALHSNIKRGSRAQRRLFKNHRQEFSRERGAVAI